MKCPNCKEPNLLLSERKGIEIDYCPECRGVWLDRGELDKILENSREESFASQNRSMQSQGQQQPSHSDHRHDYRNHPNQKPYKRKKSFLEELFD